MFVIMQCFNNLNDRNVISDKGTLQERIAQTMKHAGVAITLTSVTDVMAFFAGSVTVSEWMIGL
jgi:hypothetical protein